MHAKLKTLTPEKQVQTECMNYLAYLERSGKVYHYRTQSGAVNTVRRDGSKGFMKTGRAGTPDITCCDNQGRWIGIEVKSKIGKLSEIQKITSEMVEKLGGIYLVVRSLSELQEDFKNLNII
jgi:hypothetical protein